MLGTLRALGTLSPFRALGPLGPLRAIEPRLPLRPIRPILALRSFHTVCAPVLTTVGAAVFLAGMVGTAVFLPIGTPVLLPVRASILPADVGLRHRRGGASQGQGGYGD